MKEDAQTPAAAGTRRGADAGGQMQKGAGKLQRAFGINPGVTARADPEKGPGLPAE